jgi:protocatechuate 3,4-dioxygenase, beta subunit
MARISCVRHLALAIIVATTGVWLQAQEPIVGRPCEGCEAVFEGLPSSLAATARLAPAGEPGDPMTLTGQVLGADGRPRAGVIVYAYQTNAAGVYPPSSLRTGAAARHGALRGWALSGADGRYTFETIRPGTYPTRDAPAHIHMHVIERGCATYYIDDVMFEDDPLLTPAVRRTQTMRGGPGIVAATRVNGRWMATRDIHLGRNIPGHAGC